MLLVVSVIVKVMLLLWLLLMPMTFEMDNVVQLGHDVVKGVITQVIWSAMLPGLSVGFVNHVLTVLADLTVIALVMVVLRFIVLMFLIVMVGDLFKMVMEDLSKVSVGVVEIGRWPVLVKFCRGPTAVCTINAASGEDNNFFRLAQVFTP